MTRQMKFALAAWMFALAVHVTATRTDAGSPPDYTVFCSPSTCSSCGYIRCLTDCDGTVMEAEEPICDSFCWGGGQCGHSSPFCENWGGCAPQTAVVCACN